MRDKRFHIDLTNITSQKTIEHGTELLNISRGVLGKVPFLGNQDMHCIMESIDLIDRALTNRENLKRQF